MLTLLFVVLIGLTSGYCLLGRHEWLWRGSLQPYRVVHQREYYRVFSHVFLHVDWVHLLVNVVVLYSFGIVVESVFRGWGALQGSLGYLGLLVVGTVVSSLPSLWRYHRDPAYHSVGASGVASAVLFTFIVLNPWGKIALFFLIEMPAIVFGVLYFLYSWWMSRVRADWINHDAHLWGALAGFVYPMVLHPPVLVRFVEKVVGG